MLLLLLLQVLLPVSLLPVSLLLVLLRQVLHSRCEQWLPARMHVQAMRRPSVQLTSAGCAVPRRRLRQAGLLVLLVLPWWLCCWGCAVVHGLLLVPAVPSVSQGWGCGWSCGVGLRRL